MRSSHILAIDQGTTSSRAIVFDDKLHVGCGGARRSSPSTFRSPGWVEHDPEEIWSTRASRPAAPPSRKAGITRRRHRRHRHHQPARDHADLGARHRPADPPRHRLAGPPHRRALRRRCATPATSRASPPGPACSSTPISPAPRWPGCSTASPGARERAARGELCFGTVDSFLIWRLTGGKVHATDATNASRTLLLRHPQRRWDDELLALFDVPRRHAAGGQGLRRDLRHDRARRCSAAPIADSRRRRRPAGGDHRPGLLRARHDEIDLRHRLLRPAQHRATERSSRATGCSPPSPISWTASAPTRSKARSSSPAPRCNGCATA